MYYKYLNSYRMLTCLESKIKLRVFIFPLRPCKLIESWIVFFKLCFFERSSVYLVCGLICTIHVGFSCLFMLIFYLRTVSCNRFLNFLTESRYFEWFTQWWPCRLTYLVSIFFKKKVLIDSYLVGRKKTRNIFIFKKTVIKKDQALKPQKTYASF